MDTHTSTSYVTRLADRIARIYMDILSEVEPDVSALLHKKYAIQVIENKSKRMGAYVEFWDSLDEGQQLSLSTQDAKINHLSRMARVIATTDVVWAHNSIKATNAGSIDFVLENFRKNDVTARQVQKFIDENAQAWFSLTGHPTNPTTVAYTLAQIHVADIISKPQATLEDLKEALRTLREIPIIGPRKTPLEEAEETLGTLDVLYDSAVLLKRLVESALEKYGYADEGVRIKTALIRPCVWTLGDGDGNENMTAQVLEDGIALHRRKIAAQYAKTGEAIIEQAKVDGIDNLIIKEIGDLVQQVQTQKIGRREEAPLQAEALAAKIPEGATAGMLYDFAYLIRCFGRGFGKIDIRHNALDVIDAVAALCHASQLMEKECFSSMGLDEQSAVLSKWLEDEEIQKICAEQALSELKGEETATRILGRLRVIGENPDMCEKMIVAETTHSAHALAALFLLKITGNHIGNEQSRIDLVILSESVADLVGIGHTLEVLLENKSFRTHVASRGRLIAMIAKSDTTRQDGRGEAEYAQYEAAVDVYRRVDLMKRKYYELEPVLVSIKNGGGHALQRGGGRVTEIPALHGRAAADARVTDIGPSTLTIQGQQQTIVFCPGKVAVGSLEAFAAQNLYTKAGIQGEMRPPTFSKTINRQYARADAWLYAKTAGKAFDDLVKNNPAVDELFVAAPWLSMKAGNVSSRPAKRGEKHVGVGVTPAEAKGNNPKALQGRAISGERLSAHACLPVFSVIGLAEAMEAVKYNGATCVNPEKYGDPLHHLYRAHKIHRDAARATVNAVAMADFDIAWPLLTGWDRPHKKQVEKFAAKFVHSSAPYANSPEVTLAFLEEYFLKVEKLTYGMISGQHPKKNMRHGDALKKLWPELAEQVKQRDRGAEFSRVIECYRTRQFDAAPDIPLTQTAFEITQALYASANVINAPVGILATRTRLEPVREVGKRGKTRFMRPQSYQERSITHLLQEPPALRNT